MLKVVYRDEVGYVEISIPDGVIDMLDGKVYFSDGENDYQIQTENLMRVFLENPIC